MERRARVRDSDCRVAYRVPLASNVRHDYKRVVLLSQSWGLHAWHTNGFHCTFVLGLTKFLSGLYHMHINPLNALPHSVPIVTPKWYSTTENQGTLLWCFERHQRRQQMVDKSC